MNNDEERRAKLIAKYLINEIYNEVGKGVIKKLFWMIVAASVIGSVYLGMISIKPIDILK